MVLVKMICFKYSLMFVEFKNLNVAFGVEYPLAYVYFNKYNGERFLREQGVALSGSFASFIPLIAIVDNVPQKVSSKIFFTNYRIITEEEEKDALDTLKEVILLLTIKVTFPSLIISRYVLRWMEIFLLTMTSVSISYLRIRYSN